MVVKLALGILWCQSFVDYEVMVARAGARSAPKPVLSYDQKVEQSWRWVFTERSWNRRNDRIKRNMAEMRAGIEESIDDFPWLYVPQVDPVLVSALERIERKIERLPPDRPRVTFDKLRRIYRKRGIPFYGD